MKVETYEVEEVTGELGQMAADSESLELIEKLGLEGQRSLANQETATRFLYRKMSKAELKAFKLLFPVRVKLSEFKEGIVPLRVLQVAAFAKETAPAEMKAGLYVWHCGSAKEDPLLVGHTAEYGGEFYLLARWGDALETWDEMVAKAKKLWTVKAKMRLEAEKRKCEEDLKNMEQLADECFLSGECGSANMQYELDNM
jgi:hypothetical protein